MKMAFRPPPLFYSERYSERRRRRRSGVSKWNDQTIIHSVVVYHFDKLIRNGNYTQMGGERGEGDTTHTSTGLKGLAGQEGGGE